MTHSLKENSLYQTERTFIIIQLLNYLLFIIGILRGGDSDFFVGGALNSSNIYWILGNLSHAFIIITLASQAE